MSPVYLNTDKDPAIDQAVIKARQNFRYFWREVTCQRKRIVPSLDLACIKYPIGKRPKTAWNHQTSEVYEHTGHSLEMLSNIPYV